jgi:hypothetical protein
MAERRARSHREAIMKATADRPLDQRTRTYLAPLQRRSRLRNRNVQASIEDTWGEMRSDAWA